ncbi:MAG: SUMF1/EgtB/PvdO family nonheme iron enzyme [Myxococcales bacterium]|nr:SUMF1/EgtB/PvdO family nonheme iron enzyme [Myxococcales bacterium]
MSDEPKIYRAQTDLEVIEAIAQGGMGRILRVKDHAVGREIALKVLAVDPEKEPVVLHRFLQEARITGMLEHPNIVPVHHVGVTASGEHFFTMKFVQGESLGEITAFLRKGLLRARERYSRMRLLNILSSVCMAIHYAHSKAVIHRDLKPHNIMVGEFGEVLVMDWGLAKELSEQEEERGDEHARIIALDEVDDPFATQSGVIFGTPAYMAPEQAIGRADTIDRATDIFSLGAILYEMLTFHPPFPGRLDRQNLHHIVHDDPPAPSTRAPMNQIPAELEAICQKAMAKTKEGRYATAADLASAIEAYLEGTKEATRREREALIRTQQGNRYLEWFERLSAYEALVESELTAHWSIAGTSAMMEDKREFWSLEDLRKRLVRYSAQLFSLAERRYSQALGECPTFVAARSALAKMYWHRYEQALALRDEVQSITYANLVLQVDDGYFAARMSERCRLSVAVSPSGSRVSIYALQEVDRQWQPAVAVADGPSPLLDVELARGRYVIRAQKAGYIPTIQPLTVDRPVEWIEAITLYRKRDIGHGFCYVPAGEVMLGGDPLVPGNQKRKLYVPDFFIARFPVSIEEYYAFLVSISSEAPAELALHMPTVRVAGEPLFELDPQNGTPRLNTRLLGDESRATATPVFGVSWSSAEAFCRWRSENDGVPCRLPTSTEWEKAARGADGRVYPWGDSFDPLFCDSRLSNSQGTMPLAFEEMKADRSVYGVRSLAGGVREWCIDWYDEAAGIRQQRGGAWNLPAVFCRASFADGSPESAGFASNGFRLCRPVKLDLAIPEYVSDASSSRAGKRRATGVSGEARQLFDFDRFQSVLRRVKEEILAPDRVEQETATTAPPVEDDTAPRAGRERGLLQQLLEQHQTRTYDQESMLRKVTNWVALDDSEPDDHKTARERRLNQLPEGETEPARRADEDGEA